MLNDNDSTRIADSIYSDWSAVQVASAGGDTLAFKEGHFKEQLESFLASNVGQRVDVQSVDNNYLVRAENGDSMLIYADGSFNISRINGDAIDVEDYTEDGSLNYKFAQSLDSDGNTIVESWSSSEGAERLKVSPEGNVLERVSSSEETERSIGGGVSKDGDENGNLIIGTNSDDSLVGHGGNDVLVGLGGNDVLFGGEGNDILYGRAGDDFLGGDAGNDLIFGDEGNDTITDFEGINILNGGDGDDSISGTGTLEGGDGNDMLMSDETATTYIFNAGDDRDTITDVGFKTGAEYDDTLKFVGITSEELWLRKSGVDLEISVIGRNDAVVVKSWFSSSALQIEKIKTSDGLTLNSSDVDTLVSAMAAFSPPPPGQTSLSADLQAALAPALAASWK